MRKSSTTNSERSKVRIFYVEGDFAPGDMQELTQAMANAIRPTHVVLRPPSAPQLGTGDGNGAVATESGLEVVSVEEIEHSDDGASAAKRSARPRSYRKPDPVIMDMAAGGVPFEDFAKEKGPTSHRARHLVAAAWLNKYAKIETITFDHVFTCYKAAGWKWDVTDPTVTFRQIKKERLASLEQGSFTINHLGLTEVEKMKAAA